MARPRIHDRSKIRELSDGSLSSSEIADMTGFSAKYIQRVQLQEGLPRLDPWCPSGHRNPSWLGGFQIDLDGYLLFRWKDHPNSRGSGYVLAHRVLAEMMIGRLLSENEVVDHKDGLKLHNFPDNLRVFSSNGEHLRTTISGKIPSWSPEGFEKLHKSNLDRKDSPHIHNYRKTKAQGAVRELQIRLIREQFGIDAHDLLRKAVHILRKAYPHPLGTLPEFLLEADPYE